MSADTSDGHVRIKLDYQQIKKDYYDGILIPKCYEPVADHLAKIKGMDIRDDDVILCVYPKSGTHWLYRVIDMIVRRRATYESRTLDSTFLGLQQIEKMTQLDSPRIFVTHLPFKYLPAQIKDKRTKLVHVYRNPKSVLVSYRIQVTEAHLDKTRTADDINEQFFTPAEMAYGGWFFYMDEVAAFQKNNPDQPLFHIAYEDMKQNTAECVKSLAKFLGVEITDELCADIVQACSFDKQKAEEEQDRLQAAMKFFRKGDANDWKNHLTVALNERIDAVLKERADRCPFAAKYIT